MSNKKGMDIDNIDAENEAYFKDLFDHDEMEVPESLSAENMKMKLEQDEAPERNEKSEAKLAETVEAKASESPEAKPVKVAVKKHSWMKPLGLVAAACACFVLVMMPVLDAGRKNKLEVLPESVSDLKTFKSYKEIRKAIDDMTGPTMLYKNNGDMVLEDSAESGKIGSSKGFASSAPNSAKASSGNAPGNASGHSDTYLQVKGVDEADRVKCDDGHLYYISSEGNCVYICSADNGKSKRLSAIKAGKEKFINDMFLDGDRLITISSGYWGSSETVVTVYDISDRTAPKKTASYVQSGNPVSQRMVDGIVYIVTDQYAYGHEIPYCGAVKSSKKLQPEDICCVPHPANPEYTVIGAVDTRSGKELSHVTKAVLGGSQDIYSNGENLYVAGTTYIEDKKEKKEKVIQTEDGKVIYRYYPYYRGTPATVIIKVRMANGKIKLEKTGAVKGTINDQFSMDEKDGNFRIATTSITKRGNEVNNLFVLDSDLKLLGKVSGFAKGESIKAVRYLKDKAYVITYEETDPLFVIDLSNSKNPKIEGEVKIDGFSTLLVPLSEDRLLGIGYGVKEVETWQETSGLKFVIFDISNPLKPEVVTSKTMDGVFSEVQDDHRGLVVLGEGEDARFVIPCWEEYEEYEVDSEETDEDPEEITEPPMEPEEAEDEIVEDDFDDDIEDDGYRGGALELSAADDKIDIIDYHRIEDSVTRCPVIRDYIYAICDNDKVVPFKLK